MEGQLTTTRLRQLRQPQHRIIARHRLKRDIAVPPLLGRLPLVPLVQEPVLVDLLRLLGADDADLVVLAAERAARVADGVDVQFGGGWFAGELAEALDQDFLEVVV